MARKFIDPVSQSFFVKDPIFATKVDLFFQTKDQFSPVFMQIRRMKEGFPTQQIVEDSEVVIPTGAVNTSDDANTATTVSFDKPLFLDKGEYALALGSDSQEYKVYVAELNGTDTTTSRRITEQPLIGSLFLSENLSTFQPDLFEDLKFNLYRAKFYYNVTANVNLEPGRGWGSEKIIDSLESDPLEFYPGLTTVKVNHFNHGYGTGSMVRLHNVANANVSGSVGNVLGILGTRVQDVDFEVSNIKLNSYTIDLGSGHAPNILVRTSFGGASIQVEENIGFSTIAPVIKQLKPANTSLTNNVLTTSNVFNIDSEFITIDNMVDNDLDGPRSLPSRKNVYLKMSNLSPLRYQVTMSTVSNRVSPVIDTSLAGVNLKRNLVNDPRHPYTGAAFGTSGLIHEDLKFSNAGSDSGGMIKVTAESNTVGVFTFSQANDKDNANAVLNGSLLNVSANTSQTVGVGANNKGLYRVLEVFDNGANIRVDKIIGTGGNDTINTDVADSNIYLITHTNDFIAEEAPTGGTAYSKYISRTVDFLNESTGIKFFMDISKPRAANVEFYIKTKLAGDTDNMNDIEYKKLSNVTIIDSLSGEFNPMEKEENNLDPFNSIQFKIVMNSTNESKVPKIKNLRVIAIQ